MSEIVDPKIQILGGPEESIPDALERELMITTDTNNLYVGKGTGQDPVLVADSTVPSRVQALENKTNSILTTHVDSFDNLAFVNIPELTASWSTGYIRGSFYNKFQDLFDDSNYLKPSDQWYADSGELKIIGSTYGEAYTKNITNFDNTNQVQFTSDYTATTTNTLRYDGFENIDNIFLANKHVDSGGTEWLFYWDNSGTANNGLWMRRGNEIASKIYTTATPLSTALVTNISIVSDADNIYVLFNQSTRYLRVLGFDKSTKIQHNINGILLDAGSGNTARVLDMVMGGNKKLVLLWSRTVQSTTDTNQLRIAIIDTTTTTYQINFNNFAHSTTANNVFRSGNLVYFAGVDRAYYFGYRSIASSGASAGYIEVNTNTLSTNTVINISCNGSGTTVYDSSSDSFCMAYGNNTNTQLLYRKVPYNSLSSVTGTATITNSVGIYGMDSVYLTSTSRMVVYYATAESLGFYEATINTVTNATTNTLIRSHPVDKVNLFNKGLNYKIITTDITYDTPELYSYGLLTPTFNVKIVNTSGATIGAQQIYTGAPLIFNLTQTVNQFALVFTINYDIAKIPASGPMPIAIRSYTIESLNPPYTGPTTSELVTTPIIYNRVIDNVMLEADMTNLNYGDINWFVKTSDNGAWEPISLNIFQDVTPGTSLTLRAVFDPIQSVINVDQMPRVNGYSVSTKNIVTFNDVYMLQVNIMKLGINVTALSTANRLDYKNMMIDTFETTGGINNINDLTFSNGTLINNTANPITVTTVTEIADLNVITNIVLVAQYENTISFRISRDGGNTFYDIEKEQVLAFAYTTGIKREIVLEATFQPGAICYGWAYLYQ